MFKNEDKQRMLEKTRKYFLDWIVAEEDPKLEIAEQKIICLQTTCSKLEQIKLKGNLKEFASNYDGDFLNDLNQSKQEALNVMKEVMIGMAKMYLSLLLLLITSLAIFVTPSQLFSIKLPLFLSQDGRSNLKERIKRLEKADKSRWFIRVKEIQFLLELCWAEIQIKWDNLWLSENENAK